MRESYSYPELVQFLYRETPAGEAAAMAHRIEEDPFLHAAYDDLLLAKVQLPKDRFNPSPAAINNILQYSTKTALEAQT